MPRYDRSDIRPGVFITLDGGPCIEAPRPPAPHAPRYGDPPAPPETDFSEISEKLDAAKKRLAQIAQDYRNARRR